MYSRKASDRQRPTRAIWRSDAPDKARSVVRPIRKLCVLYLAAAIPREHKSCLKQLVKNDREIGCPFLKQKNVPARLPRRRRNCVKFQCKRGKLGTVYVRGEELCFPERTCIDRTLFFSETSCILKACLKVFE